MVSGGNIIRNKETGELYMLGSNKYVFVKNKKYESGLPHLVIDISNGSVYDSYISKECLIQDYELVDGEFLITRVE